MRTAAAIVLETRTRDVRREQSLAVGVLDRHRHAAPYAAIVLSGGYLESGDTGRWKVRAGQIVFHEAFEAHLNDVGRPVEILNIPVPIGVRLPSVFEVRDPDTLIREARMDPAEAWRLLEPSGAVAPLSEDWPDLLAAALRQGPVRLGEWALHVGLSPTRVSRGFREAFGDTPSRYRCAARARRAWRRIVEGDGDLSQIAYEGGFADQAHLSRSIRHLTGVSPRGWRARKPVQDGAAA